MKLVDKHYPDTTKNRLNIILRIEAKVRVFMSELIHIVIPFRGREDYFQKTVNSIISQTYKNWVLTVCDNANESSVCAAWVESLSDQRIEYKRSNDLIALSQNFNRATSEIDSVWGLILGADDVLEQDFLKSMVSAIDRYPMANVIMPGVIPIDSEGLVSWTYIDLFNRLLRPRRSEGVVKPSKALRLLCITNWAYITSLLVKKDLFMKFPFEYGLESTFDLDFLIKLFQSENQVVFIPDALFFYRRHRDTASLQTSLILTRAVEEQRIFERLKDTSRKQGNFALAILAKFRIGYRVYALLRCFNSSTKSRYKIVCVALGR